LRLWRKSLVATHHVDYYALGLTTLAIEEFMAKGEKCKVSNCKNIITHKGKICGTHKWRWKKYNSYDLPSYKGSPNYEIKTFLPESIVKQCSLHGDLKLYDCYPKSYKGKVNSYNCKKCFRDSYIRKKYQGMESDACFEKLLESQNGKCAICFGEETTKSNKDRKSKKMSIDHCHVTHKTRGILCYHCNMILGHAKDSIEILESAIAYIKRFS
jgi:hypothetical protein